MLGFSFLLANRIFIHLLPILIDLYSFACCSAGVCSTALTGSTANGFAGAFDQNRLCIAIIARSAAAIHMPGHILHPPLISQVIFATLFSNVKNSEHSRVEPPRRQKLQIIASRRGEFGRKSTRLVIQSVFHWIRCSFRVFR